MGRDPAWLRERAAQCREVAAGRGRLTAPATLRYRALLDPAWPVREAERCEARAAALERGEDVPDLEVTG